MANSASTSTIHPLMQGIGWNGLFRVATAGIILLKLVFLARLLTPTQFGLFSMVMIALGIMEALTETGINTTLIQSKRPISYYLDTAWVISIIRGFGIAILMMFVGFFLSRYFQEPELLFLISFASFIPIMRGFINPAIITFQKKLQFKMDSLYRISLVIFETTIAVSLAYLTGSVYSLVAALLLTAVFEVIISFKMVKDVPDFYPDWNRARAILENAKSLNLTSLLSYLSENLDNLIVRSLTNTAVLGIYDRGYALSHRFYDIAKTVHHSNFPVLMKMESQHKQLFQQFFKTITVVGVALAVIFILLGLYPQLIVSLVLGDQWLEIIPAFRPLLGAAYLQSMSLLTYAVFLVYKRYRYVNIFLALSVILMVIFLYQLVPARGMQGIGEAMFYSRLAALPILAVGIYKMYRDYVKK